MGQPKLLMPWAETTVIGQLLRTLELPWITARFVVVRKGDVALRAEVESHGAMVVAPESDPVDMRASVEAGLRFVRKAYAPTDDDAWLMLPGDQPAITVAVLEQLYQVWQTRHPRYLVPTVNGRRGHPLMAWWDSVNDIERLPDSVGLNQLLRQAPAEVLEMPVVDAGVLLDLDSPADYHRAISESADQKRTQPG